MNGRISFILFFILSFCPGLAISQPFSMAIMNFTNRNQDPQWQWLSKGLADMLITDLSSTDQFQIVERERMQEFFDEMELSKTGLIHPETASQFGKIIKVQKALFGSFLISQDQIEIEAHIIDIETQKVERLEWVKGKTRNLLRLEKDLAFNIIQNLHLKLTEEELNRLKYQPTDSIAAASHFYTGLDAYDEGDYAISLREMRLAGKQDSQFEKGHFWPGNVYDSLGEYEHASYDYQQFVRHFPQSIYADDALILAAKIKFQKMARAEEALQLVDQVIQSYPNGEMSQGNIWDGLSLPNAMIAWRTTGSGKEPFVNELRYLKQFFFMNLGRYEEALQELEKCNPKGNEQRWNERIRKLFDEAYRRKAVVLFPKGFAISVFDPQNPSYEEDYRSEKRFQDAFEIALAYAHPIDRETSRRFWDQKNERLLNRFDSIKKEWAGPSDTYYFAAPPGFLLESVEHELHGFQSEPWTIHLHLGSVGEYIVATGSYHTGEVHEKKHLRLLPGTKLLAVTVLIHSGLAQKEDQMAFIDRWRINANLVPDPGLSPLKINSNAKIAVVFNPQPGDIPSERNIAAMQAGWVQAPRFIANVPVGKHQLYAYALVQGAPFKSDGQKQITEIEIKPDVVNQIDFDFSRASNLLSSGLPGFNNHTLIHSPDAITSQLAHVKLFRDSFGKFWLLFTLKDDIWKVSSLDGKKWSQPETLPAPINSSFKESQFSILQGEDHRYYLAFEANRANGWGIYTSSSRNMRRWTNPKMVAKLKFEGVEPVLVQRLDGTFLIYYRDSGQNVISSNDFRNWSKNKVVETLNGSGLSILKQQSGIMWAAYATGEGIKVTSSENGLFWEKPTLVKDSVIDHKLASNQPTLSENQRGELVLAWKRAMRIAFSHSSNGMDWSSSHAEIASEWNWSAYPEAPVSILQNQDGIYMVAYKNSDREIWVSFSENPFF